MDAKIYIYTANFDTTLTPIFPLVIHLFLSLFYTFQVNFIVFL